MDVGDAGVIAVNTVRRVLTNFDPGRGGIGKRVFWNCAEIACGYKICEMLRRFVVVPGVLIDSASHVIKILFEDRFISCAFMVGASCNKEQREYNDRIEQPRNYFHWGIFKSDLRTRVRAGFAAIVWERANIKL